jgi:DNA-binding Lrp family transcriptional regulator
MHRKDIIEMSLRDLKRLKLIQQAIDRYIPQRVAASMLQVSERQVRRMVRRVRQEGDKGIVHRSRGHSSNHRLSQRIKVRIISLYKDNYKGFGPTFAAEKLFEKYKIRVSNETLRQWLMEEGLWKRQRKGRKHLKCRPRKECCGQMVILDGSHHDWLEGRGPHLVLMAYIDDATNRLCARFYEYEGIMPAMDSFKRYVKRYGLPQSLYTDKHTTYKSTKKPTVEDELANREPQSHFERAMEELGVEMIHANSPEAKGRIERVFRTLQDRLVKELRLRNISTKAEANRYLQRYLPAHNRRFTVEPKSTADVHRAIPEGIDLDAILCIREHRALRKDLTIRYYNKFYQIQKIPPGLRPKYVWVEERMNGKMFVMYKECYFSFKEIEVRLPKQKAVRKRKRVRVRKKYIPPADHPWKKSRLPSAVLKKRNREQQQVETK